MNLCKICLILINTVSRSGGNELTPTRTNDYGDIRVKTIRGVSEMAQKVIEGDVVTWRHMHAILRWPKIRTIQFLFDFGSKYQSRVKILRWPTFFSSKILRWPKIRTISASNTSSLRMHMPSRDNISFDDFLGHLGDPPVSVNRTHRLFGDHERLFNHL